jgi:hypothetical protein
MPIFCLMGRTLEYPTGRMGIDGFDPLSLSRNRRNLNVSASDLRKSQHQKSRAKI